jgi:uncharacterized protein (TIGR01777 family)
MPALDFKSRVEAPARDVFDWHARPGAFERLVPPWMNVRLQRRDGIRNGQKAVMSVGLGPVRKRWVARHEGYEDGRQFRDVQEEGPFEAWAHTHHFEPLGTEGENGEAGAASVLHDHIAYEVPLGGLGRVVAGGAVRSQIEHQFAYRHRITRQDLALHQRYAESGRLTVAISGASGLVGRSLQALLTSGGHAVRPMVRHRDQARASDAAMYWNHREGAIDAEALEGVDAVVHLAGENIFAPRWSASKKERIYASRAQGTRLIADTLASLDDPPEVFVSASAIGYYGDRGAEKLTEESAPGDGGFLTAVCREWETATQPAAQAGIRTVNARFGIVLSPAGGALQLMRPAFLSGLGGTVGDKEQYLPWVALDDVLGALHRALMRGSLEGPVNVTGPAPATMQDFTDTLARVMRRPSVFHVPERVVSTAMGDAADEFLLTSARVLPRRLSDDGYDFLYPTLEGALRHQLGRTMAPLVQQEESGVPT